jgi:organic radical activating enzyme
MLQGQWPGNGCEYCRDIESAGGVSDRQFQNQIPNVYPPELNYNSDQTNLQPVILEVFFSNTCNLACVYCSAKHSSAIQAENSKFGAINKDSDHTYSDNRYKELVPKFWEWFKHNGINLQRLQILGGEPFLQKELSQLIEYFEINPHPQLEFNLVTNLNVPPAKFDQLLEKLNLLQKQNKLKRIDIQASVDCWGSSQEYIRHGFDTEVFERNMLHMISKGTFRIGLLSTITSLSIPTMSKLAEKYNDWCLHQKIFWYMHLVLPNNKSNFDPTMFDYSIFESHIDDIRKHLPTHTWDDIKTLESFDGIVSKLKINCKTDYSRQQKLVHYLTENDIRRNSDWKNHFAWLEQQLKNNHVV